MNKLSATITPTENFPFSYGEYIDFVGGRSWSNFWSILAANGHGKRLTNLNTYKSIMSDPNRYLTVADDTCKHSTEIIYLKLCAFTIVSQMVQDYRKIAKCSFGDINEEKFGVNVDRKKLVSPGLWTARFAVESRVDISEEAVSINRVLAVDVIQSRKKNISDHYGLGCLLIRTFVVNHRVNFATVNTELKKLTVKVQQIITTEQPLVRQSLIEACFETTLKHRVFAVHNVRYKPSGDPATKSIDMLWKSLLSAGLRLICHDMFKHFAEAEGLAANWLSLDTVLIELMKIKRELKIEMLGGSTLNVSNSNEPLNDIKYINDVLSGLISDQKWLQYSLPNVQQCSMNVITKKNEDHNKYIDDLRAMLSTSKCEDEPMGLELDDNKVIHFNTEVDATGNEERKLQSTIAQNGSWLRKSDEN